MKPTTKKVLLFFSALIITIFLASPALAHRSGCHRWHSCPSDSGSYTCGDDGHPCQYPTYPKRGGVIYPPNGYYKDCYTCPLKKVPSNAVTSGISWVCKSGYNKIGQTCAKIIIPTHAHLLGSGWVCNLGYKKVGSSCKISK